MDEHYFTTDPTAPSKPSTVRVEWGGSSHLFQVDRGVFSLSRLDPGTALLLDTVPWTDGADVLDLGCGWGPIGLLAKKMTDAGRVVMVDPNSRALQLARETAQRWGISVDLRGGDGYGPLQPGEQFDFIVTNPPIRGGKDVFYPWVTHAHRWLKPGGSFWAVIRVRQGAESLERHMQKSFSQVTRAGRGAGYWVLSGSGVKDEPVL